MAIFRATTTATALVAASPEAIWQVLTSPELVAELTPLLDRIDAEGDRWHWQMSGLDVLGLKVAPAFTEQMTFTPYHRIEFQHAPPPGVVERSGVEGWYGLVEAPGGTQLSTSLEISLDLPLPRLAGPGVRAAMTGVVTTMGDRFSRNLLGHLGLTD